MASATAMRTFLDLGTERLGALRTALGVERESEALANVFQLLLRPWGVRRIGSSPHFPSNVADDEAPFEFSLALSTGSPELQVYVDPQGNEPTLASSLSTARSTLSVVASEVGASLDRLREIEDLFLPAEPAPPFGLWIGASWAGRDVRLKAYLNPHVRGHDRGPELVEQAMRRLGFDRAWTSTKRALSLNDGRDEIGIIALDLSRYGRERIKLYVRHHRATVARIHAAAAATGEHSLAAVQNFYAMLAGQDGPFEDKPAATVLAFIDPKLDRPSSAALAFPIGRYVATDEEARERIARYLRALGLVAEPYEAAARAFAGRPLEVRAGIHAHVTLRRLGATPRVAVYFASEAYSRSGAEA